MSLCAYVFKCLEEVQNAANSASIWKVGRIGDREQLHIILIIITNI